MDPFFTRSAHGLGRRLRPAMSRSPVPQTSIIFRIPDELILSILSHISPEPQLVGHYARFREQYCMEINDDHQERAWFLRPLSMTCRLMRLRLLPWMWNLIEPSRNCWFRDPKGFEQNLIAIADALHADKFLAASVKFMTVHSLLSGETTFVKCLESLPNLHTLEIGLGLVNNVPCTFLLREALKGVKLPQIKTLVLPPLGYPLLKHCPNVEDLDWVIADSWLVADSVATCDKLLGSLTSIRDPKIKRLAIPLILEGNASRFVARCPRLVELTILYPHPHSHRRPYPHGPRDWAEIASGQLPCPVEFARSAISELVDVCKALPDFKTLEIVHLALTTPPPECCWCGRDGCGSRGPYTERRKLELRKEMKGVKDWAIDCLKKPKTGHQEGEKEKNAVSGELMRGLKGWGVGWLKKPNTGAHKGEGIKKTVLRVIELNMAPTLPLVDETVRPRFHLGSVKVEEYKVQGVDSNGP